MHDSPAPITDTVHTAHTRAIGQLIDRLNAGDLTARTALIEHTCQRLQLMVRKSLSGFPAVRRWEETGDVLQSVLMEVTRRLESARPKDVREFFALSATIIRCQLIDLKRHYYGPQGMGSHHLTRGDGPGPDPAKPADASASDDADELHNAVARLPDELREVTQLLFYEGLTQDESAAVLGKSTKWISRRWRDAKVALSELLNGKTAGR